MACVKDHRQATAEAAWRDTVLETGEKNKSDSFSHQEENTETPSESYFCVR